jgi:hypothetical protein
MTRRTMLVLIAVTALAATAFAGPMGTNGPLTLSCTATAANTDKTGTRVLHFNRMRDKMTLVPS